MAALRALSACSASNSARFLAIAFGMAPGSLAFAAAAASAPALSSQGALRPAQTDPAQRRQQEALSDDKHRCEGHLLTHTSNELLRGIFELCSWHH